MSKATFSNVVQPTPKPKVFINFRGEQLRLNFISHIEKALKGEGINVYTDNHATMGEDLTIFFERIKESSIAIAVISSLYSNSRWCLNELATIKERVVEGNLVVFPVFYKVPVHTVRNQTETFGKNLEQLVGTNHTDDTKWRTALTFVTTKKGVSVHEKSNEVEVIEAIVRDVKKKLEDLSTDQGTKSRSEKITESSKEKLVEGDAPESSSSSEASPLFGIETRLEHLKEKLDFESKEVTRFVGVVGMRGIGKTFLAKKLLDDCGHKFLHRMFLTDVREKANALGVHRVHDDLLHGLQQYDGKGQNNTEFSSESAKAELRKSKVFIVLDDVGKQSQIEEILGGRKWLRKGSRVVIITSSKAVVKGMVDETYLVPGLSDEDGFQYFEKHAFTNGSCEPSFKKLAREFVDYSRGHPLALKELGDELLNKDEAYWKSKLQMLEKSPISNRIQDVLRIPYDGLINDNHREVFLDLACFFKFEDEYHVRSFLDSSVDEIKDLADRFLINISGGRVELNDLMYTLAMELDSQSSSKKKRSRRRLVNHGEIITVLLNKEKAKKVRGIFLDMSELPKKMSLGSDTFKEMNNLRYLKFFNSSCPRECEPDCTLSYPNELNFELQEIRYLHWLRFPLEKFPPDFDPKNLIDLSLPYSEIEKVWEGIKDISKLKWLDLNHSSKMQTLSGLSQARNLESVNLESCTKLKSVHKELQNMESLTFLNLRGCTSLESLPQMNLISLKTLILSGCSNLEEFNFISKNLEELYLDGTAIKGLPSAIGDLQRLVLLTLKDCVNLLSLPDSIGNLKALQKLVLSGCSDLASFPEVKENLKRLKTLLLDGTAIKELPDLLHRLSVNQGQTSSWSRYNLREWPHGIYGLSSVHRLCLSSNHFRSLPSSISYLYHLRWLDLKYCKELISLPMLPPNLQLLDAHGCTSLEKIETSSALLLAAAEQSHSTFIFTNCTKLDQVAKNGIVSYVRMKIQLMPDAQAHQEKVFTSVTLKWLRVYKATNGTYQKRQCNFALPFLGSELEALIGICFPGWHLPVWFNYRSVGSELKQNLPRHWNEDRLIGIALCAVISFKDNKAKKKDNGAQNKDNGAQSKDDQAQNTRILVRCTSEFKEGDKPLIWFSCGLGGWTKHGKDKTRNITESSGHVFIGYTSLLDIKKQDKEAGCVAMEASFKFEVTDGTKQITNCEVIKCGFTLIYAPAKPVHSVGNEKHSDHGEIMPGSTSNTGANIKREESHFQIQNESTSVSLVALDMGSEITEKVNSFKATGNVQDTPCDASSVVAPSSSNGEVPLGVSDGATPKIEDNTSGGSMSPVSSQGGEDADEESPKKEETNEGVEPCSSGDTDDQSLSNGVKNLCEMLEKPIRLVCLVISVYAVAAFSLRKEKRKR